MNTTIQSKPHQSLQSNFVILFVLIQLFFLIILIILFFCFKNTKEFKVINYYFKKLPLLNKIIIFLLFNSLVVFIAFTLNQNSKINITKLQDYFVKFLFQDFKILKKITPKINLEIKNKFNIKADEQEILSNKYYFDDSEENKRRVIKTTFHRLRRDPRDFRMTEIKQNYQDDDIKGPNQFQIKAIHIKSEANAYVNPNYNYDELILLDKLLTDEIETFQSEQFDGVLLPELNDINSFLRSLGQMNDIEKNPNDYILQYKKLPPNPTKLELCYNYLAKKRILNILRFELEKDLRTIYTAKTGKLLPFIVY